MHDDDCEKLEYEGGICTCSPEGATGFPLDRLSDEAYYAEPSNMADLEDGITSSELW